MPKYHPYSRREFRARWAQWGRRNAGAVSLVVLGLLALMGAVTTAILLMSPRTAFTWWMLGVFHGGFLPVIWHILRSTFLAQDRDAMRHLRGAWGEELTRDELKRAQRRRLIWGSVDSINLQVGDIDHFVVTRRGGLVVIDSKWRNEAHDVAAMVESARKVRTRAEGVARSILARERSGRRRASVNPLSVTPVIVLWGAVQHTVPDGFERDGVHFVAGRRLKKWLAGRDGESVSAEAARDLLTRLEGYRARSWDDDRSVVRPRRGTDTTH